MYSKRHKHYGGDKSLINNEEEKLLIHDLLCKIQTTNLGNDRLVLEEQLKMIVRSIVERVERAEQQMN